MRPDTSSSVSRQTMLFSVFGLLALLVAAVGVFSNLSHEVSQRRHELGVRAALGASLADIVGLVVGQGIRVVGLGALLGLLLALAGSRLVASLLYGVAPRDPSSLAVVVLILIVVAAVASSIPAWRASRADPLEALKAD
jgi:putative ABC transport system permease protein